MAAAAGDLRPWHLARQTPLAAWALVAIFGLLGIVYAIAVPLLHGPDEGAHVDRIATRSLAEQFTVDPSADMTYSPDLLAAYGEVGIIAIDHRVAPRGPWEPLRPAESIPAEARPSYPGLAPEGAVDPKFVNAARSHPPGYYATVDTLDEVLGLVGLPEVAESRWDTTIARWRVYSALLLLPIPWAAFWIAVRISRRRRTGLVAATLTLACPQLSQSAGTVNNDALLFAGAAVCALATVWIATGDRSSRVLLWAGFGAGVSAFSKIFGIAAPLWIVVAMIAGASMQALRTRNGVTRLALAAATTIAAGGWFTVATLVGHGTVAPRGFGYVQPDNLDVSFVAWLREAVERLPSTGFGRLGIEQFGLPGWSVWLATLLLVGLVGVGVRHRGREGAATSLVLLLPMGTTLAMVAWAAWGGYSRSGVPSGLHGRYLFVGAAGLAALAAVGLDRVRLPARQWPWGSLAIAGGTAALLQSLGLVTALSNYWPGGWKDRVRTAMVFSGWTDPMLAVLAVVGVAVLAALVIGLRREPVAEVTP